jgi:hypothetical protein
MKKTLTSTSLSCLLALGTFFIGSEAQAKPYTKAFRAKYDSVWKATLIALSKYPLEKNDKTSGEISTTLIEGDQVFKPYNRTIKSNEHYKLEIILEKRVLRGQKIVVLRIEKKPMIKGDFMNVDREIDSDGIEENVLLYRISREVSIDRAVEKLFK